MQPPFRELAPGQLVGGRFRLSREINRGGMGALWIAFHETLRIEVVLKFLVTPPEKRELALARFAREANVAAQIKSPHVVNIIDFGVDGQLPYLAMELLHGEDLAERLKRAGPLTPNESARIITQACKGLYRAHATGTVHRDIKPENIFLCEDDEGGLVKLLDFGVAKQVDPSGATVDMLSTGKTLLGTPPYMSPEQALGHGRIDFRSDLFSIAVVAYRCLTGRLPWMQENFGELVVAICTSPHPKPSSLRPSLSVEIDSFFKTALEKDPARRFGSARELAEAFRVACATCGVDRIGPGRRIMPSTIPPKIPAAVVPPMAGALLPPPRPPSPSMPSLAGGVASPAKTPIALPSVVAGVYVPTRMLASSSSSKVFLVTQRNDATPRVLNVMMSYAGLPIQLIDTLRREVTTANRVQGEHVIRVFDVGVAPELGGVPYLLLEYADVGDLESITEGQSQPSAQVLSWLSQAAVPLSMAHAQRFTHRDLRPSRLLLSSSSRGEIVKVSGFGLAGFADEVSRTVERATIRSAPHYLSPEQARGKADPTSPTIDVWAIGMIAFRLLAGRGYWPGGNVANMLAQLVHEPIVPPSARGLNLGAAFDQWFLRSCHRDPAQRFANVEAQLAALHTALR
ncbi:MAG: protein kinase [Polyangiaceae bacterium]